MLEHKSPGAIEQTRYEKIHTVVFEDPKEASIEVAKEISSLIIKKQNSVDKKNATIDATYIETWKSFSKFII